MNCTELMTHFLTFPMALDDTTGFVVAMACLFIASLCFSSQGNVLYGGVSALAGIGRPSPPSWRRVFFDPVAL